MAMIDPGPHVKEHMEVVGSDGGHVGVVDKVENRRIKLTRNDPAAGGEHHYIHLDTVDRVEGGKVHITRTAPRRATSGAARAVGGGPAGGKGGAGVGGGLAAVERATGE
jgi:hypothetical protein